MMQFNTVQEAVDDLVNGRVLAVCGSSDTSRGILLLAAQFATPANIDFLMSCASGELRLTCAESDVSIPDLTSSPTRQVARTPVEDVWTSADSARFIRSVITPRAPRGSNAEVFAVGTASRPARSLVDEAGQDTPLDLVRLAGLVPAALTCEINEYIGDAPLTNSLPTFAAQRGLSIVSLADVMPYRLRRECLVDRVVDAALPTRWGQYQAIGYRERHSGREHVSLVLGDIESVAQVPVPVRIHHRCLLGDVFKSRRCGCGENLTTAMSQIEQAGKGIIIYLSTDAQDMPASAPDETTFGAESSPLWPGCAGGRGMRLNPHLYGICAQILESLGAHTVQLLDDDRTDIQELERHGIQIASGARKSSRADDELSTQRVEHANAHRGFDLETNAS